MSRVHFKTNLSTSNLLCKPFVNKNYQKAKHLLFNDKKTDFEKVHLKNEKYEMPSFPW